MNHSKQLPKNTTSVDSGKIKSTKHLVCSAVDVLKLKYTHHLIDDCYMFVFLILFVNGRCLVSN